MVAQVFGAQPRMQMSEPARWRKPTKMSWANYDADTDSMIMYLTGRPVRGVQVYLRDDIYAIVDPDTHNVVGMYVDAWESQFRPGACGRARDVVPGKAQALRLKSVGTNCCVQLRCGFSCCWDPKLTARSSPCAPSRRSSTPNISGYPNILGR